MSIRFDNSDPHLDTAGATAPESSGSQARHSAVGTQDKAMTDGPETTRKGQRNDTGKSVESLASEALKVLARSRVTRARSVSDRHVAALRHAVTDMDFDSRRTVVQDLLKEGVSQTELIDLYIPEVARQLGDEWCKDQTSFADVTIGAARLQGLLRELLEDTLQKSPKRNASGVAVVVISDEFHTLGALVLTAQLRRLGVSVRLLLDSDPDDVLRSLSGDDRFDAIMISASHVETLTQLARFIERVKTKMKRDVPIVVGGPVLGTGRDVKAVTGADFATSDVVEALRLCQLRISPHVAVANAKAR